MKKIIGLLMGISIILIILSACGTSGDSNSSENSDSSSNSSSDEYEDATIRLAYNLAPEHHISRGIEKFAEDVKDKSNGKVKIETYPSGQLLADTDMNQAILSGGVEMGVNGTTLWSTTIPEMGIFDLPFALPTYEIAEEAIDGKIREELSKELEKKGGKILMFADFGYNQLINKKRPIKNPEDYEGLKIRTVGDIWSIMLESFGASPVNMGAGDVYMAMQTGTIDGATTGLSSMIDRSQYEVGEYVTVNNYSYLQFLLTVNKEYWDGLPEKTQKLIQNSSKETEEWIRAQTKVEAEEALDELREKGLEIYTVPEEEYPMWRELSQPAWDEYLKNTGPVGEELVEYVKSLQ